MHDRRIAPLACRARRRARPVPVEDWMRPLVASLAQALLAVPAECRNPVPTVCARLGLPERRVRRAFQAVHSMTPLQWLRERRLDLARAELLAVGDPRSAVKRAALSHRHWHRGRFAAAYRARFGELPSETIARRATPDRAMH